MLSLFTTYDYGKIYETMMKPAFVFDGRNILDLARSSGKLDFVHTVLVLNQITLLTNGTVCALTYGMSPQTFVR